MSVFSPCNRDLFIYGSKKREHTSSEHSKQKVCTQSHCCDTPMVNYHNPADKSSIDTAEHEWVFIKT